MKELGNEKIGASERIKEWMDWKVKGLKNKRLKDDQIEEWRDLRINELKARDERIEEWQDQRMN